MIPWNTYSCLRGYTGTLLVGVGDNLDHERKEITHLVDVFGLPLRTVPKGSEFQLHRELRESRFGRVLGSWP